PAPTSATTVLPTGTSAPGPCAATTCTVPASKSAARRSPKDGVASAKLVAPATANTQITAPASNTRAGDRSLSTIQPQSFDPVIRSVLRRRRARDPESASGLPPRRAPPGEPSRNGWVRASGTGPTHGTRMGDFEKALRLIT